MKKFILLIIVLIISAEICLANQSTLDNAWYHYLKGEYEKAVETLRSISKTEMLGEEGYYLMGLCFLKLDNLDEARKNFEFILHNYSRSKKIQETLLGIADAYYLEGKWNQAQEYYNRLLRDFPKTDFASMAYLRLGECRRRQGNWQESNVLFKKLVEDFPMSLESERAKEFLKQKLNFFSIQVGAFSKKRNAENFARQLQKKGHDAYIEKTRDDDRLLYRVKVGRFDSKEEAEEMQAKLKRQGYSTRICT